jgi:hypothetical protein
MRLFCVDGDDGKRVGKAENVALGKAICGDDCVKRGAKSEGTGRERGWLGRQGRTCDPDLFGTAGWNRVKRRKVNVMERETHGALGADIGRRWRGGRGQRGEKARRESEDRASVCGLYKSLRCRRRMRKLGGYAFSTAGSLRRPFG